MVASKAGKFQRLGARLANIVLAGGGVLCLVALSYFVYYYSWTGQRHFTSRAGIVADYFLPAIMAALLLGSLKLHPSDKVTVALLLCSTGACLYVMEASLTIWFHLPSVIEHLRVKRVLQSAEAQGIEFDTRSKRQVIQDFRKQGIDAVTAVSGHFLIKDQRHRITINGSEAVSLAGVSNKFTVLCNESGKWMTYTSDEHGFNNPQHIWDKSTIDIAAVGDSFTHGWCVPPDKNFVSLIRNRWPATLNLGIEDNGPLLMLATLKEYVRFIKPKVVLWFYFEGNDLTDLQFKERIDPLLMRYLGDHYSQNLISRQPEIDRSLTDFIETVRQESEISTKLREAGNLVTHSTFFGNYATVPLKLPNGLKGILALGELRSRLKLMGEMSESPAESGSDALQRENQRKNDLLNLFYEILSDAKQSVSEWGGTLYFVYLPSADRYLPQDYLLHDTILHMAETLDIPAIDVAAAFDAQKDPRAMFPFYPLNMHYNEEGHRVVAEAVLTSVSIGR